MVGRCTNVMPGADRLDRAAGLRFPQDLNDLFLAESTPLHVLLLLKQNFSYVTSPFWGSGQPPSRFLRRRETPRRRRKCEKPVLLGLDSMRGDSGGSLRDSSSVAVSMRSDEFLGGQSDFAAESRAKPACRLV